MLASIPALLLALAPPGAELRWNAPGGCPDAAAIRDGASALLGRTLDPDPAGERVLVAGTIAREPGGFRLDLELRRGPALDRRTLRDPRCEVLAESAALIVAAAIDPDLGPPPALPPDPSGPAPTPANLPPPEPVPTAISPADPPVPESPVPPDIPDEPAPTRERLRGAVRLTGVFDQGSLSAPTGGPALAFALLRGRWRLELGGLYLAPRVARPDPERDLAVRLSLGTASLRGCGVARLAVRLELAGCGGLEAGVLIGRAVGAAVDPAARSRPAPWLAAVVGAVVAWSPRPRLAFLLDLGAAVPLLRPSFTLRGFGPPLFDANPAAFRAGVGVEARFP